MDSLQDCDPNCSHALLDDDFHAKVSGFGLDIPGSPETWLSSTLVSACSLKREYLKGPRIHGFRVTNSTGHIAPK
jgi:hypothetical protein